MKIKLGVIGVGGIAMRRTIPEAVTQASEIIDLVAVMDIDEGRAKAVAAKFNVPRYCATEDDLLSQDIDAVYIATPSNAHCPNVVKSAEAGKHILCEKPMANTLREVDEMEAAVKKAGVKFMLGFCMRNNVYNIKARDLVQSGAIGQVVMGRAQLTCWYPPIPGAWRQDASISGGGSFIDMGTHGLDLLEWIMGSNVKEVTGFQDMLTHAYSTKVEDSSTILLHLDNGAHGIVDNYFNIPDAAAQNMLEIYGTKGTIIAQGTIGQDPTGRMFSILQPQETGYDASQVRNIEAKRKEYHLRGVGIYGQMLTKFARSILDNTDPPVTLQDARHSVEVVEAVYRAVSERRVVTVKNGARVSRAGNTSSAAPAM